MIYEGVEMAGMNGRQGSATILLADDDRSLRGATAQMLSEAGYVCAEASNGSQALEEFTNVKPDLVILDIMMPGLDGFEVCERIGRLTAWYRCCSSRPRGISSTSV